MRSALRLPVPPGEFRHPDFAAAFAKADRDAAKQRVSPAPTAVETAPKKAAPDGADGPDLRSRETLDASVFHNADILAPYTVAIEGEASVFSFGTLEDVWFRLVHELSWSKLIVGELLSELLVILLCGSLLTLAQVIEEQNVRFRDNVILALTTVRLSTDKIFGWQPTKASTPLEITVLAIYGWIHWLLLSVASALIVARALRPARSGIFSPDSVVNDDSLQVRRCVLERRHRRENSSECVRSTARRSTRQRAGSFHGPTQLEPVEHGLPLQHGIYDAGHDFERADRGSAAREKQVCDVAEPVQHCVEINQCVGCTPSSRCRGDGVEVRIQPQARSAARFDLCTV